MGERGEVKKRIVVMASGNGSTFQAIVEKCQHAEVVLLVTDNCKCKALDRARKLGINTYCIERKQVNSVDDLHQVLLKVVKYEKPDLVVLAGYMRILPDFFVAEFPRMLNIHPSLLPKYKGLNTYQRVLDAGDQLHGTTIHQVIDELDSGPVVAQQSVFVLPDDTADTLRERTQAVERSLYPKIIDEVVSGRIGLFKIGPLSECEQDD